MKSLSARNYRDLWILHENRERRGRERARAKRAATKRDMDALAEKVASMTTDEGPPLSSAPCTCGYAPGHCRCEA